MTRVYVRKFDYDEAARRHKAGETIGALAREYGVTWTAVKRAIDPATRKRMNDYATQFQMQGACLDCGATVSLYTTGKAGRQEKRCTSCAARHRITTVRDSEILCHGCKEWKPDESFPHSRSEQARRGRHSFCRSCQTKARRAYRERVKIPCVKCGSPRLPHSESRKKNRDSGLCAPCWVDSRRKVAA